MKQYDIIIVGGGISGLSMAHYCAQHGWQTLLLEQSARLGGTVHSQTFPNLDGFWLEMGAHTAFNSYGNLLEILDQHQLLDRIQKKQTSTFQFLLNNQLKSIPSQLHYFELLIHIWNLFKLSKAGKSVAEYYQPLLGAKNYRDVFSPAFDAVICQPSRDFPADMLFRKKKRRQGVLRSFTFANGLQVMPDHIAQHPNITVLQQQTVEQVVYQPQQFIVSSQAGRYQAAKLALATPVNVAKQLLNPVFPTIAKVLSQIKTVKVESVGVVLPKEKLNLPPVAGVIAKNDVFYSFVSRDTVLHPDYRGFTFHFKDKGLTEMEKLQRIGKALYVQPEDFCGVYHKTNVLPALRAGHDLLMEIVDTQLDNVPLALVGNYFLGVSMEECTTRARIEFERLCDIGSVTKTQTK